MIQNPFIKDAPVQLLEKISKDFLIEKYKEELNIEVHSLLSSCDTVDIYECQNSGYRFYYPFTIGGDSKFYESLQEYDWYYLPWKWEHQLCEKFIHENDKILEVGCGRGDFIKRISSKFNTVTTVGLELNESSVFTGENYKIVNSYVEDFSADNLAQFDVVCSFQVLEHISNVNSFLDASIKCLKDNGLLVIAVPNNDSFIKYNKQDILNMPPHHAGLWTEKSLRKIAENWNLEVSHIAFEPLQEYHFDYYTDLMIKKYAGSFLFRVAGKIINSLKLRPLVRKFLKSKANRIKGHSVFIVFKKTVQAAS